MNLQVITSPDAILVWVSPPLPGRMHDLTAVRRRRVIATIGRLKIPALADKAYTGASSRIAVPAKYRPGKELTTRQRAVNQAHARLRARSSEGWPA